jgi:hypothetical protein
MKIAVIAGKCQIGFVGRTAMLPRNDVLNMKTKERFGMLVDVAVLASIGGSLHD